MRMDTAAITMDPKVEAHGVPTVVAKNVAGKGAAINMKPMPATPNIAVCEAATDSGKPSCSAYFIINGCRSTAHGAVLHKVLMNKPRMGSQTDHVLGAGKKGNNGDGPMQSPLRITNTYEVSITLKVPNFSCNFGATSAPTMKINDVTIVASPNFQGPKLYCSSSQGCKSVQKKKLGINAMLFKIHVSKTFLLFKMLPFSKPKLRPSSSQSALNTVP
mmetsp:Transcript_115553/g.181813  ORF Transcript_115553/g.181813 Transcript_115553/m.181813 type:complete len:217 (-) Transcript_115553:716-1366(-)